MKLLQTIFEFLKAIKGELFAFANFLLGRSYQKKVQEADDAKKIMKSFAKLEILQRIQNEKNEEIKKKWADRVVRLAVTDELPKASEDK